MKRTVDLTDFEEAALTQMVQQSNAVRLERDADAQLTDEAEYFDLRVHEVLGSYVSQTAAKTEAAILDKYRRASDSEKQAVDTALANVALVADAQVVK